MDGASFHRLLGCEALLTLHIRTRIMAKANSQAPTWAGFYLKFEKFQESGFVLWPMNEVGPPEKSGRNPRGVVRWTAG
jgi:hypothetical protein